MKNIITTACLLAVITLNAQSFEWAKAFGGINYYESVSSIILDPSGNVYTTGMFDSTIDFDPGAGTTYLSSVGALDVFIQKLDASGNFLWAKAFGGTLSDYVNSITVDIYGNIYTTGYFGGTVDFDPGAGTTNLTSAGGDDVFIQKLDASGNFLWAKVFGGVATQRGNSIAVDVLGNVYTTGGFNWFADFDPGAGITNLYSVGGFDVFIQKLDPSGNFLWAKALPGSTDRDEGISITTDASGNVYTTGNFHDTVDFDPGSGTANLISVGEDDVFIQKLDASGNFLWAKAFGGTSNDYVNSITLDIHGNIYTTGTFRRTVDFDPGSGTTNLTSVAGGADVFVHKLDASGNFIWAKTFGGTNFENVSSITTDISGNVYTTGSFQLTVDFDPGAGVANLSALGWTDVFIQKLDTSGNFLWAKAFGSTLSDFGKSIAVDASGDVYTTGNFHDTVDFDPGAGTVNLTSVGREDIFVQKMSQGGVTGIFEIENGIQLSAYPNPSSGLVNVQFTKALTQIEITVLDAQAKIIYSKHLDTVSSEQIHIEGAAGIYFLKIKTATSQSIIKLIKE